MRCSVFFLALRPVIRHELFVISKMVFSLFSVVGAFIKWTEKSTEKVTLNEAQPISTKRAKGNFGRLKGICIYAIIKNR